MSCTCNSGHILHMAYCESVQATLTAIDHLRNEASTHNQKQYFYIAKDAESSWHSYETFKRLLPEKDWLYSIEAGGVSTLTLQNGSEITFLPEVDAHTLTDFDGLHKLYVERTENSDDLLRLLTLVCNNIVMVDSATKSFTA